MGGDREIAERPVIEDEPPRHCDNDAEPASRKIAMSPSLGGAFILFAMLKA